MVDVYALKNLAEKDNFFEIYEKLGQIIVPSNDHDCLLGDFNVVENPRLHCSNTARHNKTALTLFNYLN